MKLLSIPFLVLITFILTSCGADELSKSKASAIMNECQEKAENKIFKTNQYTYGVLNVPDPSIVSFDDFLADHLKLEQQGMVIIGELKKDGRQLGNSNGNVVEVRLTPKGEEYLVGKIEESFGRLSAQFKSCEYKTKEILEIQEIPERNEAMVKVAFERFNETPFFEEGNEEKNPKEFVERIPFRKTTDGWKFCD